MDTQNKKQQSTMDTTRECELFEQLVDSTAQQQGQLLENIKAESPETCDRLKRLLAIHQDAETATSQTNRQPPVATRHRPGEWINGYEILEFLGAGGEAEVYLARQHEPFQRNVALKLLRRQRSDSAFHIARFESEKSALAMLAHPGIAKLYDAGATPQGLPYCVVEYVAGDTITDYVAQRKPAIKERLRLFVEVCSAVQHANENGVLHRDIKPSNIIVTETNGRPRPVVIDFGIAKIDVCDEQADNTLTRQGDLLGTLGYIPPERLKDARISNFQTEVFALGALLYELISGTEMVKIDGSRGILSAVESLKNHEVVKPSQAVLKLGQTENETGAKRSDINKLSRQISGELDWICLKSVDKTPANRYNSVRDLREDVRRYLDGDLVEAAPPKRRYQLRKFFQRHRRASFFASFLFVLMGSIAFVSTFWALKLDAANKVANQLAVKSQNDSLHIRTVLEFMMTAFDTPEHADGAVAICGEQLFNAPALEQSLRQDEKYPSTDANVQKDDVVANANGSPQSELILKVSAQVLDEQRVKFYEQFAAKQIARFGESSLFVVDTLLKKAEIEVRLKRRSSLETVMRVRSALENLGLGESEKQSQICLRLLRSAVIINNRP